MRRGRIFSPIAAVIAAALIVISSADVAVAHDEIVSSSPAVGADVRTEVQQVSMTFSEELLSVGTNDSFVIQVRGPDNRYYETRCPALDGSTLMTPVSMGGPGVYRVTWQIVSQDGHTNSDSFVFTYDAPESATASAGFAAPLTCSEGSEIRKPQAADTQESPPSAPSLPLLFGIIAVVLGALALTLFLLTRQRKPGGDDAS